MVSISSTLTISLSLYASATRSSKQTVPVSLRNSLCSPFSFAPSTVSSVSKTVLYFINSGICQKYLRVITKNTSRTSMSAFADGPEENELLAAFGARLETKRAAKHTSRPSSASLVSFSVTPARLADGLEAKNLLPLPDTPLSGPDWPNPLVPPRRTRCGTTSALKCPVSLINRRPDCKVFPA